MLKYKAYASALEWSVDDVLDMFWPNHRLLQYGSPEWLLESVAFWAAMAYGNYDLCIAEDEEEYP